MRKALLVLLPGMFLQSLTASAVTIADFEPDAYTAGSSVYGTNGWNPLYGTMNAYKVTPDYYPPGSGYTFVMEGSQSTYLYNGGGAYKKFNTVDGLSASSLQEFSYLITFPDARPNSTTTGFYLTPNPTAAENPGFLSVGVEFAVSSAGERYIQLLGYGTLEFRASTWLDGGGGGGVGSAGLNAYYQVRLVMDYASQQFTAYYQDVKNSGPELLIGTQSFNRYSTALTPELLYADGAVLLSNSGSVLGIDSITAVPEPGTIALSLLGLGVAWGMTRRRS